MLILPKDKGVNEIGNRDETVNYFKSFIFLCVYKKSDKKEKKKLMRLEVLDASLLRLAMLMLGKGVNERNKGETVNYFKSLIFRCLYQKSKEIRR